MAPLDTLIVTLRNQTWHYALSAQRIQIGRGSQNDITLIDDAVSRRHALLTRAGSGWSIADLGSANGTRVNDRAIDSETPLQAGDTIEIGAALLCMLPAPVQQDDADQTSASADDATVLGDETRVEHTTSPQPSALPIEVDLPDTRHARVAIRFQGRVWSVPLGTAGLRIGRGPDNDVVLDHPRVSRRHAHLTLLAPSGATISDERSANGTYVDGRKVTQHPLTGVETVQIGPATLVFKPAFDPDDLVAQTRGAARRRKPIVFIPGFMGTQLWDGESLVWPNLRTLLTRPEIFKLPEQQPLRADGLVEEVVVVPGLFKLEAYSQLTEFLSESLGYTVGKDLLAFGYDWRKDLRIAAQQLKDAVIAFRATLPDPGEKVILIAHSMGSLVTRYFVDVLGGDQMAERVILMGGPQQGTPKIVVSLLTGKGLLPRGLLGDQLRDIVSTFHGAYQLLPDYPTVFDRTGAPVDIFSDPRWAEQAFQRHIEDARAFRNALSPSARLPTLCVVGYGNKTISKAIIDRREDGRWADVDFVEDDDGDSTIPVDSAILDGADIHPVQQSHGALFVDNDVKFRLRLELTR